MQKISIEEAKPEMTLAKPIVNEKGLVLCGKGLTLTEALISELIKLNVKKIFINESSPSGGFDEKKLEKLESELDQRFSMVEGDSFMMELKEIFKKNLRGSF